MSDKRRSRGSVGPGFDPQRSHYRLLKFRNANQAISYCVCSFPPGENSPAPLISAFTL
jgi:hypothetical protein